MPNTALATGMEIWRSWGRTCSERYRALQQQPPQMSCCIHVQNWPKLWAILHHLMNPNPKALLTEVITDSVLYKHPEDFIFAMETCLVESFNNVMNVFQDNRISLLQWWAVSVAQAHLAVCLWNENADRDFTSVWKSKLDPRAPRRKKGKLRRRSTNAAYSSTGILCGTDTWRACSSGLLYCIVGYRPIWTSCRGRQGLQVDLLTSRGYWLYRSCCSMWRVFTNKSRILNISA